MLDAAANLVLVRSIFAAWKRGAYGSAECASPEIESVVADGPERESRTGLAEMVEFWRDFLNAWEDFRAVAEDYRELDCGRVLVFTRFSARGKASGMELGQMRSKTAALFHVRDRHVTRLVIYWDREHALAD